MIKVFGHISPDTDATGSAIIWAWYLNTHTTQDATAYVLGQLNNETLFVLNHWNVATPALLESISPEDKIAIVGVENWGRPPFPQKGDLEKALQNTAEHFKILLSHDPTHWDLEVKNHPSNIDLTLSGHTHGMQFGVEIPGIKWSPVKYLYPHWAGLYRFNQKRLNVNRGFGFLGYPGRVGIWPEITVIELNS